MPLINAGQLDTWRHGEDPPCILDASWHQPETKRDAHAEFLKAHVYGARFLNLDLFTCTDSSLPSTLSTNPIAAQSAIKHLGIHPGQPIVFYDRSACHTALRAYWIFRLWGFPPGRLFVLDGGFDDFYKQGFITSSGESKPSTSSVTVDFQPTLLKTLKDIKAYLHSPRSTQIIDLRHPVRFAGGPEPRPGLRCGHIPGSFCFPMNSCFNTKGYFLPFEKILQRLKDIGIDMQTPIITTCGSGMTAAILNFILDNLSHPDHALYDGSWAEWGADHCLPGETTGPAERPVETCVSED